MSKKTVFLTNSDEIDYFEGRFLVTSDEHVQYLAHKQKKQERMQLFKKLLTYWRKRR